MRPLLIAVVLLLFVGSAGVGVAWARTPPSRVAGGTPATAGPSSRPEPSPSPSPPPPCTTDLIVNAMVHDREVLGNPRPYAQPSSTTPAPEAAIQFDLPQQYSPGAPAFVLVFRSVADRVRAQFAYPESDNVGGAGRLIWSIDSVAVTYSAPYRLTLADLARPDLPCGQPAG